MLLLLLLLLLGSLLRIICLPLRSIRPLHLLLVHLLQWSQELVEVAVEVLQEIQLKAVTKMADLLVMMVLKT